MNVGRHRLRRLKCLAETLLLAGFFVVIQSRPAAAQGPADAESPATAQSPTTVQGLAVAERLAAQNPIDLESQPTAVQPVEAKHRDRRALTEAVIATVAGNLFDGLTTIAGVRGGHAREVNPLLGQNPARILVLKGLLTLPQILAEKHLVDHGHATSARWVGYAVGGFAAAVAIHNVRVISH
jgi:hypothetical protein